MQELGFGGIKSGMQLPTVPSLLPCSLSVLNEHKVQQQEIQENPDHSRKLSWEGIPGSQNAQCWMPPLPLSGLGATPSPGKHLVTVCARHQMSCGNTARARTLWGQSCATWHRAGGGSSPREGGTGALCSEPVPRKGRRSPGAARAGPAPAAPSWDPWELQQLWLCAGHL